MTDQTLTRFMELNGLDGLRVEIVRTDLPFSGSRALGWYLRETGAVTVQASSCVEQQDGLHWRGHAVDLTEAGVVAHELGHALEASLGGLGSLGTRMRALCGAEPPLTQYACTKPSEDFAEAVRLYALNPHLLLALRPERHAFLAGSGVRTPEDRDWRVVLAGAPQCQEQIDAALYRPELNDRIWEDPPCTTVKRRRK
jgi:hypothetical protein